MSIKPAIDAPPKRRINSSSSDTKKRDEPDALTASAAAQLKVDARSSALGAQHMQATEQSDTVGVALALRVGFVPGCLTLLGCGLGKRNAGLSSRRPRPGRQGLPPSRMSTPRPCRVVGGDDRARPTRLCDDPRFTLVLLGVQHLVHDAAAVEPPDRRSDFSTDVVPTRIGRPFLLARSRRYRANLASSVLYTRSAWSPRIIGRCVGTTTTSRL